MQNVLYTSIFTYMLFGDLIRGVILSLLLRKLVVKYNHSCRSISVQQFSLALQVGGGLRWDSKVWLRVLRDPNHWVIALETTDSILSSERVPHRNKTATFRQYLSDRKYCLVTSPRVGSTPRRTDWLTDWPTDRPTDRPSVSRKLTSNATSKNIIILYDLVLMSQKGWTCSYICSNKRMPVQDYWFVCYENDCVEGHKLHNKKHAMDKVISAQFSYIFMFVRDIRSTSGIETKPCSQL
jgi:hypothetical protein